MNKLTTFLIEEQQARLEEQQARRKGGLYHKTQVQLAYNSNRIEGEPADRRADAIHPLKHAQ